MQLLFNDENLSFEQATKLFPKETEILKNCQNLDWKFIISNDLWKFHQPPYKPISIDIENSLKAHKVTFFKSSPYSEQIAKAIGLKAGKAKPSVLDATGGLLGDTLLMLSLGLKKITVFERHPLAACLITSALNGCDAPIEFKYRSAGELDKEFDVIFFDPMYADKNSKAQPKKEMALFRQWIGEDQDASEVARRLKNFARQRLVIKRSIKAPPILESPDLQFKGKSTRYDVYLSL